MNNDLENSLRRVLRNDAHIIDSSVPQAWQHPASRAITTRRSRRIRQVMATSSIVAAASVVVAAAIWASPGESGRSDTTNNSAVAGRSAGGLLGPGCGIPAVDVPPTGTTASDGLPTLAGEVGRPLEVPIRIDPGRPNLTTSAQVLVAAPGTQPGRGFTVPGTLDGALSIDDAGARLAVVDVTVREAPAAASLPFTPTEPGRYPVYVIEHARPSGSPTRICGGIPDSGGDAENVVAWIEVR